MTEPQVWAVIAVLASMSVGTVTIVSTLFLRVLRAEIGGLRGGLGAEISGLRQEMNARFETVDAKLDHLDRDVNALTQHVFGAGRD